MFLRLSLCCDFFELLFWCLHFLRIDFLEFNSFIVIYGSSLPDVDNAVHNKFAEFNSALIQKQLNLLYEPLFRLKIALRLETKATTVFQINLAKLIWNTLSSNCFQSGSGFQAEIAIHGGRDVLFSS